MTAPLEFHCRFCPAQFPHPLGLFDHLREQHKRKTVIRCAQ